MNLKRILATSALCSLLFIVLVAVNAAPEPAVDIANLDLRDGDIVFQHWGGELGAVICDVSESDLSHCGLVVHRKGEPHVLEAVGPVRYISFKKWLKQGEHGW